MKGKRKLIIAIVAIIAVIAIAVPTVMFVCKSDSEPQYTYTAAKVELPDYETDKFNIDGKLDEEIYKTLNWWSEEYLEGNAQEPVTVRSTSYLGKDGFYICFDVDDDNVNVNNLRSSFDNSGVALYLAAEGTHKLQDNVWEIEILPNNYINAKRYLGGYYFATVKANGKKNTPFVKTKTKGGAINTSKCKGYVMEAYFPYNFLFKDGKAPESVNLNFALQRSYNFEAQSRDVYYNFGQNVLSGWSWSDPGSWWVFDKNGLDSVDLVLNSGEGGSFEFRNDYIARYQTEKINIVPDKGYRIASLYLKNGEQNTDVTDKIVWAKKKNYIKLYNVVDNVELDAEFEKIPDEKHTLSGKVTYNSSALSKEQTENLSLRFITGGVVYNGEIASSGAYSLDVPVGKGVLQVVAKEGYIAKELPINNGSSSVNQNINLTSDDYGKNRVIKFNDEQIIRNREQVLDASGMLSTMNTSFTYDFNLKYDGQLLDKNGIALEDPTFGEYDNEYTGVTFKGEFVDAKNKAVNGSSLSLQIMHWFNNDMWRIKLTIDYKTEEFFLRNDDLRALGKDGLNLRIAFSGSKLTMYQIENGKLFRLFAKDATVTTERYLKTIDFYSEDNVNHSKWYLTNQKFYLGKNEANYSPIATVANTDGSVDFKTSEKTARTALNWARREFNGVAGFGATIRIPSVVNSSGKIVYNKIQSGYWCNTSKTNSNSWYQHNIWIKGDGQHYYIEKTNNKNPIELNKKQIKLLGTKGLDVGWFASGKNIYYFVDNGDGEIIVFGDLYDPNETSPWFPYTDTSNGADLIHNGNEKLGKVYSLSSRVYTGIDKATTPSDFVTAFWGKKYAECQKLNPLKYNADADNTYFVQQHNDVYGNAYYTYNLKTDAVNSNGKVEKSASFYITTKAWAHDAYYEWRTKLFVSGNTAYVVWGQGVTPYNSSSAVYYLTDEQIKLLGNEGLNIYLSFENNSKNLKLYADNGYGKIVLISQYDESMFANSTNIETVRNIFGYAVKFNSTGAKAEINASGCVLCDNYDFATAVKVFENKTVDNKPFVNDASLIVVTSDNISTSKDKINLDYLDGNIGGNWVDCFNIKMPSSVDKKGNVLKSSETQLIARLQGDKYYGNNMRLILSEGGGKLAISRYGGDWETYYYVLDNEQLKQLGKDGLNIYVGHTSKENAIAVYAQDGNKLVEIKQFAYGSNELLAKGYTITNDLHDTEKISMTATCLYFKGSIFDALKSFDGNSYTKANAPFVFREIFETSKVVEAGATDKSVNEHKEISDNLIYSFNVKSDVVDKEGKVKKSTTLNITEFMNKWKKQFHLQLCVKDNVGYIKLQQGDWANWRSDNFYLTANQLKHLSEEKGMNFYIAYDHGVVYIYLQDGNNLVKMFSFAQSDFAFLDSRFEVLDNTAKISVKSAAYTYDGGTSLSALNNFIGGDSTEITDIVVFEELIDSSVSLDSTNTTTSTKHADKYGNFFYKTVIKDEVVSKNGEVSKVSETNIKYSLWGSNWENIYITLHLDSKGSYIKFTQQDTTKTSAAMLCYLTSEQLKQIGNDGLSVYLSHKNDSNKEYSLYVDDNNVLNLIYTFKTASDHAYRIDLTKNKGDSVTEVKYSLYGYPETVEFAKAVGTVCGNEHKIGTDAMPVIFEEIVNSSVVLNSDNTKSTSKHTDKYGNFFYKTVIKDEAVSSSGKISAISETVIKYNLWGTNWENAYINVHIDQSGSYLKFRQQVPGKAISETTYNLTDKQVKKIGNEGLCIYLSHRAESNKEYLVYLADDHVLNYVYSFKTESDHSFQIDIYKGDNDNSSANKNIECLLYGYPESIGFAEAVGASNNKDFTEVFYVKSQGKEQKIGNAETMTLKHGDIYNDYFYKLNIASAAVNSSGKVLNDTSITLKCSVWESNYKNLLVSIDLKNDKSEITCKTHNSSGYSDVLMTYQLTDDQLKKIGGKGLEIYLSHSAENETDYALWIPQGDKLVNIYTFKTSGNHSYTFEVYANKATDKVSVSLDVFTYFCKGFSEIVKAFGYK